MKFIRSAVPLIFAFYAGTVAANAQNGLDAYFGVGTAQADSSHQLLNTFGDGTLYGTPKMTGTFGKFGGDIMFNPHFGIGAQADFRFSQGDYAGLKYRPIFYDFNAIWHPIVRSQRVVPEFQAGLGAVNLRFYYPQSYCDAFSGCSSSNSYLESSNHFQTHFAGGVKFYVTDHVFIRPQVDVRWVNNFFQFGSSWVPEYGASIGYTIGGH